jgi:xanthine dehydrogenase accessory factor
MHRLAAIVETWQHQRRTGAVARVIAAEGLGPQQRDQLLVLDGDGRSGGTLLGGAVQPELIAAARTLLEEGRPHRVMSLAVDPGDAAAAGLTCGGSVDVLLQRLDVIPAALWESFADSTSVALVTALDDRLNPIVVHPGGALVGSLGTSGLDTLAQAEAEALLERPGAGVNRVAVGDLELIVEAWDPTPRLLIVGAADLSDALVRQAELLGWHAATVIHADAATARIEQLDHGDAVVVIDHDPFVATPALAAALRRGVGYVGALGSRRTQEHRRQHLREVGTPEPAIDRLHGPAGLDLGGRNPAETAVSIIAEIIATRAGRHGEPLTTTTGRINR